LGVFQIIFCPNAASPFLGTKSDDDRMFELEVMLDETDENTLATQLSIGIFVVTSSGMELKPARNLSR
jgi:hypothetical protein